MNILNYVVIKLVDIVMMFIKILVLIVLMELIYLMALVRKVVLMVISRMMKKISVKFSAMIVARKIIALEQVQTNVQHGKFAYLIFLYSNSPMHLSNNKSISYCCDESCKSCKGPLSTDCISCYSGKFWNPDNF